MPAVKEVRLSQWLESAAQRKQMLLWQSHQVLPTDTAKGSFGDFGILGMTAIWSAEPLEIQVDSYHIHSI